MTPRPVRASGDRLIAARAAPVLPIICRETVRLCKWSSGGSAGRSSRSNCGNDENGDLGCVPTSPRPCWLISGTNEPRKRVSRNQAGSGAYCRIPRTRPDRPTRLRIATRAAIIAGDSRGAMAPHGGMSAHMGSAQSVSPLLSLSIPSRQAGGPLDVSNWAGVRVGVTVLDACVVDVCVVVLVGVAVGVLVSICVGVAVLVRVAVAVLVAVLLGVLVGVAVGVCVGVQVGVLVRVLVGLTVGELIGVAVGLGLAYPKSASVVLAARPMRSVLESKIASGSAISEASPGSVEVRLRLAHHCRWCRTRHDRRCWQGSGR
jgi:hypothetical protein